MAAINTDSQITIVGAGIVGLSMALELHQAGFKPKLYEATLEIQELGVGLSLLPHSVKHLYKHGLQSQLDQNAIRTRELLFCCEQGKTIWREPRGKHAGYDVPQYSIHRGRLQAILLAAVKERLGPEAIICDRRLVSFEQDDNQVSAQFVDRSGQHFEESAQLLIAADGINSAVRSQLYPKQGEPHYAGLMLWRGASWADSYLTGETMLMAGHNDQKLVVYPMTPPRADGKQLINWVAEFRVSDEALREDDWNAKGQLSEFAARFANWRYDFLDCFALFEQADAIYKFPMIDRDPVDKWHFDRVVLTGDAAHAMYPNGSNGASQGILDCVSLSAALTENDNLQTALKAYETDRLPKTKKLTLDNRGTGPERVLQMVKERCQSNCMETHSCVPQDELEAISLNYKKLAGFDKSTVNTAI